MGCSQSKFDQDFAYAVPINSLESCKGESQTYRNPDYKDGLAPSILGETDVRTVHDAYIRSFKKYSNVNFLGTREVLPDNKFGRYNFKTYGQSEDIAAKIGSGLLNLGLVNPLEPIDGKSQPEGSFVIIWCKNREEWVLCDIACVLYKLCLVPVYDTLGPETVNYIFSQTRATTIVASNDHIDAIIKDAAKFETLRTIVALEAVKPEQKTQAEWAGLKLITYSEVIEAGNQKLPYRAPTPDDFYTVNYTSGTTGLPKGVIIAQRNQLAASAAVVNRTDIDIGTGDIYLSYLPLAHTMERTTILFFAIQGSTVGFYNGDVQRIKEDLQELQPTFFISVPRLYGRFYDKMQEGLNNLTGMKKSLANKAVNTKLDNLKNHGALQHGLYDSLVFKKMKAAMGGKVRLMLSGSAPIEPAIQNFLRIALAVPFVEGYGQTETCAASFISRVDIPSFGHVGGPLSCIELKVVDVPEMEYTSRDKDPKTGVMTPRGEICLRGPSCFTGYYKDPERTAETIDKDGWVHTGDIGRINPDGSLSIIDRKKNIFKLAQGEYVAAEKVENVYMTSKYIAEAFLYGDSYKAHCVAICVVDPETLKVLAKELGLGDLTVEQLCQNKEVKDRILADMNKKGKDMKINSFELAKQLHLEPTSFAERQLLTPTFKLIRHQAKQHYQKVIEELYALPLPDPKK